MYCSIHTSRWKVKEKNENLVVSLKLKWLKTISVEETPEGENNKNAKLFAAGYCLLFIYHFAFCFGNCGIPGLCPHFNFRMSLIELQMYGDIVPLGQLFNFAFMSVSLAQKYLFFSVYTIANKEYSNLNNGLWKFPVLAKWFSSGI